MSWQIALSVTTLQINLLTLSPHNSLIVFMIGGHTPIKPVDSVYTSMTDIENSEQISN